MTRDGRFADLAGIRARADKLAMERASDAAAGDLIEGAGVTGSHNSSVSRRGGSLRWPKSSERRFSEARRRSLRWPKSLLSGYGGFALLVSSVPQPMTMLSGALRSRPPCLVTIVALLPSPDDYDVVRAEPEFMFGLPPLPLLAEVCRRTQLTITTTNAPTLKLQQEQGQGGNTRG